MWIMRTQSTRARGCETNADIWVWSALGSYRVKRDNKTRTKSIYPVTHRKKKECKSDDDCSITRLRKHVRNSSELESTCDWLHTFDTCTSGPIRKSLRLVVVSAYSFIYAPHFYTTCFLKPRLYVSALVVQLWYYNVVDFFSTSVNWRSKRTLDRLVQEYCRSFLMF